MGNCCVKSSQADFSHSVSSEAVAPVSSIKESPEKDNKIAVRHVSEDIKSLPKTPLLSPGAISTNTRTGLISPVLSHTSGVTNGLLIRPITPAADGGASPADKSLEEVMLLDFLNHVAPIGCNFIKHGNHLFPHTRRVFLQAGTIINYTSGMIPLSEVVDILPGKFAGVFTRLSDEKVHPSVCFSVVAKNRTLDLQAKDIIQRDQWVSGLHYALSLSKGQVRKDEAAHTSKIMVKVAKNEGSTIPAITSIPFKSKQDVTSHLTMFSVSIQEKSIYFSNANNEVEQTVDMLDVIEIGFGKDGDPNSSSIISFMIMNEPPIVIQLKSSTERDEIGLNVARSIAFALDAPVPVSIVLDNGGIARSDSYAGSIASVSGISTPMMSESGVSTASNSKQHLIPRMSPSTTSTEVTVEFCKQGEVFLKHGKHGAPHERRVYLDVNKKELSYTSGTIKLSDIVSIVPGKTTSVFASVVAPEDLCFSIVTKSRTLDLETHSREKRDEWIGALLIAWAKYK